MDFTFHIANGMVQGTEWYASEQICFGYHFVDSTVNACIVRPEVGLKLKTINEVYAATTHSNYYLCTKIQFCIPYLCSIVNYNESKRRKKFIHTLVASI